MQSENYFQLTNPQQRIWYTEQTYNVDMSNIGYIVELKGEYDLQKLVRAIQLVVKANDGLNMRFTHDETGNLVQYFPGSEEVDVTVIEASDEGELNECINRIHRYRFDVTRDRCMCQFAVFSIGGTRFGFFQKANHLVADGISANIVSAEVMETYEQLDDPGFKGVQKDVSYFDFIRAEKEYLESDKCLKNREYWLQQLEDFQGEDISFEFNKTAKKSLKVNRKSYRIPAPMIPQLEEYLAANRLNNFSFFMAALAVYLNRFFNHDDMIIGMPVHNRNQKIFRKMVGMFVSTVPLRITFQENWSFSGLMAHVKRQLWDALKHQAYPFNLLVKDLDMDTSGFLNVQLIELPEADDRYVAHRTFFNTEYNISQLSIYLNQQKSKRLEDLDIAVDYHDDIFTEREVDALFKRLTVVLEQVAAEPETKLSELTLLEETEYREMVYHLNTTDAQYPGDKTLPLLFKDQVLKNPDNIALEYEGETVTYERLDRLSNVLAVTLHAEGIRRGAIVGMLCERSIEAVVSILAIQKAGGAYVPIDPEYPQDRKKYIIRDSGLTVLVVEKLLTEQEHELLDSNMGVAVITVDHSELEQQPAVRPHDVEMDSDDLAYVIYTSGTTGKPKGTLLRHRNVINYAWWGSGVYVAGKTVTFPLFTSLSFDLTVTSIFIPLITGNKIVIYRDSSEGLLVERVVKEDKVDFIKLTPSHLKVVNQLKFDSSRIKQFVLGGEELTVATANESIARFGGDIKIYNEYGPTETAVGCMIHTFDPGSDTDRAVPIGKPSANVRIYILDKNRKPQPPGIAGEIYIGGKGVSAGYLNKEPLTREKFVDDPFYPGEKMYRSGDLGRWNLYRILEFFGRSDEQVKIRGFRIELGEIEKHLMDIPGVTSAVVTLRKGEQADLCAYIAAGEDRQFDVTGLRKELSRDLPNYMIPAEFVRVEEIPLTRNGKVDLRKLGTMGETLTGARDYTAPRDEMETMLADIWAAVLEVDWVGITDNFFEMGGDSIKAVQIAARLNDAGKTVNVKDILGHQTVAAVCANVDFDSHIRHYEQGTVSGEKGRTPIESWFLAQNFHNPNYYNQSVLLDFKIPPDTSLLARALTRIMEHHDGLRLNYNKEKNCFYFNNELLNKPITVDTIDLSRVPEAELDKRLQREGQAIKAGMDITGGHLLRAVHFKTGVDEHKLLLTLHHVVVDGYTWRIFLEQLYELYTAMKDKKSKEMPQKTASLHDWYDALVMYRESAEAEKEKEYWLKIEAASREFSLPYDRPPQQADWRIENQAVLGSGLDANETEFLLKDAHETYKTDVQILTAAALVRMLRKWTGSHAVTLELESHGRTFEGHGDDIDNSKTTGWFTAIYPLLVNRDDRTIGDEIKSVKEAIRKVPNSGIGYGVMKYMTETGNDMTTGRAQVRFNYLGQFGEEVENPLFSYCATPTGPDVDPENHMTAAIEINAMILGGMFQASFLYNKEVFDQPSIESFKDSFISNLQEILEHIKGEDDVHFTPSDFDTLDGMDEDDLAAILG